MKTLPLTLELTELAISSIGRPAPPQLLLRKIERILSRRPDIIGKFTGQALEADRQLGPGLRVQTHRLQCELSSLYLQLAHLQPRGEWQVQQFRFE